MQLKTFLLDLWLEEHEHAARYNLGREHRALMDGRRFARAHERGRERAVLENPSYLLPRHGSRVAAPRNCSDVRSEPGIEIRPFELRFEDGFEVDVDAIKGLVDENTELILVNSPHNRSPKPDQI